MPGELYVSMGGVSCHEPILKMSHARVILIGRLVIFELGHITLVHDVFKEDKITAVEVPRK